MNPKDHRTITSPSSAYIQHGELLSSHLTPKSDLWEWSWNCTLLRSFRAKLIVVCFRSSCRWCQTADQIVPSAKTAVLSNGKRVKGKWHSKFTMALATAGMCCLGGPQRSLFNLLANGNGDETIRSDGDAFRSLDVFWAIEWISADNFMTEAKYRWPYFYDCLRIFFHPYKVYSGIQIYLLMLLNTKKRRYTEDSHNHWSADFHKIAGIQDGGPVRAFAEFFGFRPFLAQITYLCFALFADKGRTMLLILWPFLLVSIS